MATALRRCHIEQAALFTMAGAAAGVIHATLRLRPPPATALRRQRHAAYNASTALVASTPIRWLVVFAAAATAGDICHELLRHEGYAAAVTYASCWRWRCQRQPLRCHAKPRWLAEHTSPSIISCHCWLIPAAYYTCRRLRHHLRQLTRHG